jgi:hypothetical protein
VPQCHDRRSHENDDDDHGPRPLAGRDPPTLPRLDDVRAPSRCPLAAVLTARSLAAGSPASRPSRAPNPALALPRTTRRVAQVRTLGDRRRDAAPPTLDQSALSPSHRNPANPHYRVVRCSPECGIWRTSPAEKAARSAIPDRAAEVHSPKWSSAIPGMRYHARRGCAPPGHREGSDSPGAAFPTERGTAAIQVPQRHGTALPSSTVAITIEYVRTILR